MSQELSTEKATASRNVAAGSRGQVTAQMEVPAPAAHIDASPSPSPNAVDILSMEEILRKETKTREAKTGIKTAHEAIQGKESWKCTLSSPPRTIVLDEEGQDLTPKSSRQYPKDQNLETIFEPVTPKLTTKKQDATLTPTHIAVDYPLKDHLSTTITEVIDTVIAMVSEDETSALKASQIHRNLCLVNKRFFQVASRLLYRTPCLVFEDRAERFLRTICRRLPLAKRVYNIHFRGISAALTLEILTYVPFINHLHIDFTTWRATPREFWEVLEYIDAAFPHLEGLYFHEGSHFTRPFKAFSVQLLSSFPKVKHLGLSCWNSVDDVSKIGWWENCRIGKLQTLELHYTYWADDHVPFLFDLLQQSPQLRTFSFIKSHIEEQHYKPLLSCINPDLQYFGWVP
ncbi:hypothetical protein BT69DRAFT_1348884 [Atractiella rhizophila]|nr:hypothetical protein BT69DRAFT_1348884 [Atractiella rhizophila]